MSEGRKGRKGTVLGGRAGFISSKKGNNKNWCSLFIQLCSCVIVYSYTLSCSWDCMLVNIHVNILLLGKSVCMECLGWKKCSL